MTAISKKHIWLLFFVLSMLSCGIIQAQMPAHPRILLLSGEEEVIRKNMEAEPAWAKVHQVILTECDQIITLPSLERIQTGRRLLSVSREALRRIFYLSYAYP
ncbi:MAG: hypothetical protein LBE91_15535 [Tannerella sp.]|jgi:hypothetical protein|nr:hypothetical protein [Tannerella sp.]